MEAFVNVNELQLEGNIDVIHCDDTGSYIVINYTLSKAFYHLDKLTVPQEILFSKQELLDMRRSEIVEVVLQNLS